MISEYRLVQDHSLPRTSVRRFRTSQLVEGEDWNKDFGYIAYTESGIEALAEKFGFKTEIKAKVMRRCKNPHLIEVIMPDGSRQLCRVKPDKWVHGRKLIVEAVRDGLYRYTGVCPRKNEW